MSIRRDDALYTLASNLSATGAAVQIKGGDYMFFAEGTIGGATVTLQMASPNGTFVTVGSFTAGTLLSATALPVAFTRISLPSGSVKFAVTGGTPSALYAYLQGMG